MVLSATERLAILQGGGPTTEDLVLMVRNDDTVIGEAQIPERGKIEFEATNIRYGPTGVHARLQIASDLGVLACDVFNVERSKDRTYLANQAGDRMGDSKRWGKPILVRLEQFCARLWPTWLEASGSQVETVRAGDENLHFVLEPFIIEGGGTILFAPPGKGKSWTGMLWTLALTYGLPPWSPDKREVMYVNLERPPKTLRRRMLMLGKALGVENPALRFLHSRGGTMRDHICTIREDIKRHNVELVVLDSLSRTGAGDLNSNQAANETMDMLNSVGVSWLALAHTPKHGPGIFGSRMFEAAADITVALTPAHSPEGDKLGTHLEIDKSNDLPRFRSQTWTYEFSGYDLTAVRPSFPNEFPDLNVPRTSLEQVIGVLEVEGSMTVKGICEATDLSQASVYRILKNSRFVKGGRGWALVTTIAQEMAQD